MSHDTAPLRILTVCTGNICRSPVAERLLARHLAACGLQAVVRSAGIYAGGVSADRDTARAVASLGVDLTDHRARVVDRHMIDGDGADLVLAMTREHLRHVAALQPSAWRRVFTLKEFVRRAGGVDAIAATSVAELCAALSDGRRATDALRPDPDDDVADPYGRGHAAHSTMVTEVDGLAAAAARVLFDGMARLGGAR